MTRRSLSLLALAALALSGCVEPAGPPTGGQVTATTGNAAPSGNGPDAGSTNGGPSGTKSATDRLRIGVVPKGMTHSFWQTVKAGADAAGKEVNAEILWQGPQDETSVQQQQDIVMRLAAEKVDGIALAATDKEALSKTVADVEKRGIPVVTIDSGITPDTSRAFIATDNVAAAAAAAKEMGRLLDGKGKVAVISFKRGAGTSDEREQGFLEGIKAFPGIKVVAVEDSQSSVAGAQAKMEAILSAHPDLNGVFPSNEPNVAGAAKVIETRKLTGRIKVVGFDASEANMQYLDRGVVQALVVQDPFRMGYEGVTAIAQIARGQGSPPKRVDTGAKIVTKENLKQPDIHKLLNPPIGK